jgi:prophage tail gpP-like protein
LARACFIQIAQSVCQGIGINTKRVGNPPGADLKFERVCEHVGETVFQFMERLSRIRNLHVVDDENRNLIWTRASSGGGSSSADPLVEGQNIKSARIIIESNLVAPDVTATGKRPGTDDHWGADCMVSATAANPGAPNSLRRLIIAAEQPTDKQGCQMRANHELNLNTLAALTAEIEVQGWHMSNGALWMSLIGDKEAARIQLNSPMIWPTGTSSSVELRLKGVKHL